MYPVRTVAALTHLGFKNNDFDVSGDALSSDINRWYSVLPKPTVQEIEDDLNDLTTINGQLFSQWDEEHFDGVNGDPVATKRREAKEQLDNQDKNAQILRAFMFVVMDELNTLRALHSLPDRTPSQLRTAIKNKISAGDADT